MRSPKSHKINAMTELAATIYQSDDPSAEIAGVGEPREETILTVAPDDIIETQNRGILQPALRVMLDAMAQDYAKILTRIDRIASETDGDHLPPSSDDTKKL